MGPPLGQCCADSSEAGEVIQEDVGAQEAVLEQLRGPLFTCCRDLPLRGPRVGVDCSVLSASGRSIREVLLWYLYHGWCSERISILTEVTQLVSGLSRVCS